MTTSNNPRRRRDLFVVGIALASLLAIAGSAVAVASGQGSIASVRAATEKFHSVEAAVAAGYGPFYLCTDENSGLGAMGQHYVNGALVGDPAVDPLTPEAVIYEPKPDGTYRLVGVEYVTFQAAWDETHSAPPSLFGRTFKLVGAGNRYGLPAFYQLHLWLWRPNPSGLFNDWNPKVSCRGNGDPA
jgi:hypothetical protein